MKYKSLHEIVHSVLLQKGYSVHFYMQVLKYSADCLRELHFDVIGSIRTRKLEVNSYGAIDLPCDYVDSVRIGIPYGGDIISSGSVLHANRLTNLDANGNKIPYGGEGWRFENWTGGWVYPDGLHFTRDTGTSGFTIIPERSQIQFASGYSSDFVILDYITDGSEIDNAVQVHPYAQACIEAYVFWQLKSKNRSYGPGDSNNDKLEYDRQYRILRGRKSDLTPSNVRASMMRAYGKIA